LKLSSKIVFWTEVYRFTTSMNMELISYGKGRGSGSDVGFIVGMTTRRPGDRRYREI
jgi:hypothetical protein